MVNQIFGRLFLVILFTSSCTGLTVANKTVVKKAKETARIDTLEEFPTYETVYKLERQVIHSISESWSIVKKEVSTYQVFANTDHHISRIILKSVVS